MFQRVLAACAVAILLVCAPMGLKAQEREARAAEQAPVLGWLAGLWDEVADWFTMQLALPEPPADSGVDGGCDLDPDG